MPRRRQIHALLALGAFVALLAAGCDTDARAQPRPPPPQQPHAPLVQPQSPEQPRQPQQPQTPLGQPRTPPDPGFFGLADAPTLAHLRGGDIAQVERGRGGRSAAFKITLSDGTKGYYKPEQTFSAAHWYAEIAAFHLDRELGLGRVPPVVGRRFEWSALRRYISGDSRASEVIVGEDGTVRGCLVWWIPDRLFPWRVGSGWERWVRMQGWPSTAITPFQRARMYVDQQHARRAVEEGGEPPPDPTVTPAAGAEPAPAARRRHGAPTPDMPERPSELSDMVLFDYLTNNIDRWGGGNANVLTRGRPGALVFLDNAAGFTPRQARNGIMDARLHVVQRFRRALVDAIRALDVHHYAARLATDPLAPVLTDEQLADLETRRRALLEHVADTEHRYGDGVYAW